MPFTGDCCQLIFMATLKNWILAASPNAQLLDEVGNTVKSFTLASGDISYYQSGSTVIIRVHIRDESNESYTFRRVQILGQNPEGGSPITVIDHTLEQNYSKGASQILDAYVYTGIQDVI